MSHPNYQKVFSFIPEDLRIPMPVAGDWQPDHGIPIAHVRPNMTSLQLCGIITDVKQEASKGGQDLEFYQFTLSDASGSVTLYLVGEAGLAFKHMDIVRISGGRTRLFKDQISVYVKKDTGSIVRTGQFNMLFSFKPNLSDMDWVMNPANPRQWIPILTGSAQKLRQAEKYGHQPQPSCASNNDSFKL
ncbi:hypothetical protein MP228_013015 [Amoeboaphelidium protococcarum]|nr:hypothetical protein MP228_013015 [Amoeboaphelidium protococcarum]